MNTTESAAETRARYFHAYVQRALKAHNPGD